MGRPVTSWWCQRSQAYYVRLGEFSEATGKRKPIVLRDESAQKIRRDDKPGRLSALAREMGRVQEAERRSAGPSVAEVCNAFVAWHRANGSSPRTVADHAYHLDRFCSTRGDGLPYANRAAASVGVPDLTAMRREMEARGNQTGYLKLRYASVLACWRWAARPVEGREPVRLLAANPFDGLARPRRGRGRNQALPWPITRRLIRRAWGLSKGRGYHRENDRDAERLRLLRTVFTALTGARPDEAARLRWSEIVWGQRVVRQEHSKTSSRTGKARTMPLTASLTKALARLARWPGRHPEFVFLTARSRKVGPPTGKECGRWFNETRGRLAEDDARRREGDRLELPPTVTLYWLRHDWQSFGLEVVSVEGVAAAAGNSPGVLLSTYEHTESRRIREVGDTIERARRTRRRTT